ncbi:MAG: hypothetical protein RSB23_05365 [Alistipes sp.]
MMKTLIQPAQVIQIAFADGEFISPETITETDIATAEQRYILPVIGLPLYEKLLANAYPPLLNDYLAPALALYTRIVVQPNLTIRTSQLGTTAPQSACYQPAATAQIRAQMKALRQKARTLLHRLSEHLNANTAAYPAYNAQNNTLTHCTIDGNFIQTR